MFLKKPAFTLVEVLIVVAILGILAAIVLPEVQGYTTQAKETAAKDTLHMVRTAVERYANDHNGTPPGYINGAKGPLGTALIQLTYCTNSKGQYINSKTPQDDYIYGPYVSDFPKNPFNDKMTIMELPDETLMPESATGANGWIYKAKDKEFRMDWPGTDSEGTAYYAY